jgi:hypothetical protein
MNAQVECTYIIELPDGIECNREQIDEWVQFHTNIGLELSPDNPLYDVEFEFDQYEGMETYQVFIPNEKIPLKPIKL